MAALLFVSACARAPTREATIVRDSAGVTIVDNDHLQPRWTRETAWRLSPRPAVQVGNQPSVPDQRLYRAEHARRLSDGGIAVANSGLGDVRIFDSGGYHVRTIPFVADPTLESPRPIRVYQIPGDTLVVYVGGGELSLWDRDLDFVRRTPISFARGAIEGELEPTGAFADGSLLVLGSLPPDPTVAGVQRTQMRLMRYGTNGQMLDSFGDFDDETEIIGEGTYVFGPSGYVATADSTVWHGAAERFELREVARGGRTLRIVRLDKPAEPVTAADRATFRISAIRQLRPTVGDSAEAIVDRYEYAETFPAYEQIVVDDLGNIWTLAYRWFDMGADRLWTVFDRDGRYLGEVIIPYLLKVDQIGADFVLGRMADGRGAEAAYIYGLEKPAPGAVSAGPPS